MKHCSFSMISKIFCILENNTSRIKITEYLADFYSAVILKNKEDLIYCIYLTLNLLSPVYIKKDLGISEITLIKAVSINTSKNINDIEKDKNKTGDLGTVISCYFKNNISSKMTIKYVFNKLVEISEISGKNSIQRKINIINILYNECSELEALYLTRIILGKLRIGVAEQSVVHALGIACTNTPLNIDLNEKNNEEKNIENIKKLYSICPNFEVIIKCITKYGFNNLLNNCNIIIGIPLKPMLATPAKNIKEIKTGFDVICEYKYDGERLQIHIDKNNVNIFSRNQDDNTEKYPDIVKYILESKKKSIKSCIIEGEVVAWDIINQIILPFQELSKRKKKNVKINNIEIQVCLFLFDILYCDNKSLIDNPLNERKKILYNSFSQIKNKVSFVEQKIVKSITEKDFSDEILSFLEKSSNENYEGIMIKDINSTYEVSKRSNKWTKIKKDYIDSIGDTIDLVVIGGYYGKGKRAGVYGGYLLASYNNDNDSFETICKLGTGFSDEYLTLFKEKFDKIKIKNPPKNYIFEKKPDVWFEAKYIWEIKCAEFSLSSIYTSGKEYLGKNKGISLRFPRFIKTREDKDILSSTTSKEIFNMMNI